MALHLAGGMVISDLDPQENPGELDAELRCGILTEFCVRDNRAAPTNKEVVVSARTDKPSVLSWMDHYLPAGEYLQRDLLPFQARVIEFEIRWRPVNNGSPMWATTGKVKAPAGKYFPVFGIRWDQSDMYSVIAPSS